MTSVMTVEDATELLGEVARLNTDLDDLQQRKKQLQEAMGNKMESLVEALTYGATTGNALHDLVLKTYGYDLHYLARASALQKRLEDKTGQYVAVLFDGHARARRKRFFGTDVKFMLVRCARIGVLAGESLLAHERMTALPVSRFVQGSVGYGGYDTETIVVENNINAYVHHVPDPGHLEDYLLDSSTHRRVALAIGDVEVLAALEGANFNPHGSRSIYRFAEQKLSASAQAA